MTEVVRIVPSFAATSRDLWWLLPILDPGFLLMCAGGLLIGILIYVALDLLGGTPSQKYGMLPLQEVLLREQEEKRKLLHRMRIWIEIFLGAGVGVAILGLLATGTMTLVNVGIALVVVISSTVVLNAPVCGLIYLYRAWIWHRARIISQR